MNNFKRISDELLAKYMSGQTTPEEREVVLAYLAENDENVEDFMQMCAAVELQKDVEMKPKRSSRKIGIWLSSAAAAVVLFAVCLFVFHHENNIENPPVIVVENVDSLSNEEEKLLEEETVSSDEKEEKILPKEGELLKMNSAKQYAETRNRANACMMIIPSRAEYVVSQNRKTFDFCWNANALVQVFMLKDKNGNTLYSEEVGEDCYVKFKVDDYKSYGELFWVLSLSTEEGEQINKSGKVIFE